MQAIIMDTNDPKYASLMTQLSASLASENEDNKMAKVASLYSKLARYMELKNDLVMANVYLRKELDVYQTEQGL